MSNLTNIILEFGRKAFGLLARDFSEIQSFSGSNAAINFADKAAKRTFSMLKETLGGLTDSEVILSGQISQIHKLENKPKTLFLVSPIDSTSNFLRSIQFFATTISAMIWDDKKQIYETNAAVMYFPATKQVFYANNGQGAWMQDFSGDAKVIRLRIKNNVPTPSWLTVSDRASLYNAPIFVNKFKLSQMQFRNFGSPCFATSSLLNNKAELVVFAGIDNAISEASILLCKEAGGMNKTIEDKKTIYSLLCSDMLPAVSLHSI
ncbi:MAG: hypothetical protein K9G11_02660 [Rickettsiaceae bacterium]|nr:hypothetical protein [Rickettsiaceae bacterium]